MKLLSVIVAAVIVCHASAVTSCYKTDGTKEACVAGKNDQACYRPLNTVVDNTFTESGCGTCAEPVPGAVNCEQCTEAASVNCNTYEVPKKSYNCMSSGSAKKCEAPADSQFCFMAAKGYTGEDPTLKAGGCGSCLMNRHEESETMCMQCRGEKCNDQAKIDAAAKIACQSGAAKMATFLAPILAVLFSILY